MNDLQIDYFMAVATNLSFTKTSEELFVSQPAISKQIAQLEKELGAKLFKRNNQKTELTEVGKLYFELFRRFKTDLVNTRIEAARLLDQKKGLMRVGFLEGWDLFDILPDMIERFKSEYPETEVVINCCGVKELTTLLLTDAIDVAVTMRNSIESMHELSCNNVKEIRKILLYSSNGRFAGRDDLAPLDFKDEMFFAPWQIVEKMIIDAVNSYMRPYGFTPKLRFVQNHESMITCVRNDMGVAVVDEWVWAKDAADLAWIPINATDMVSVTRVMSRQSEQVDLMEEILCDIIR